MSEQGENRDRGPHHRRINPRRIRAWDRAGFGLWRAARAGGDAAVTDIAIATSEALRELTGYVRPDAQRRWLDANGVRYVKDRHGHPKVAADVIAKLFGVRQAPPPRL